MEEKKPDGNVINMYPAQSVSQVIPKTGFIRKSIFVVLVILIILAGVSYGSFVLGEQSSKQVNTLSRLNNPLDPMFANLTGSLNGKITKIEGNRTWVESQKGGEGIFNIEEPVSVTEFNNGGHIDLGSNIKDIRLNENASIRIRVLDGRYTISGITYFKGSIPEFEIDEASVEGQKKAGSK